MNEDPEISLKVCQGCDAPLPYLPQKLSFYNINKEICDDCLKISKTKKKTRLISRAFLKFCCNKDYFSAQA